MSLKKIGKYLPVLCATGLLEVVTCPAAYGGIFDSYGGRATYTPAHLNCQDGPPKLKFKKMCPKPVCNPCCLLHYGYFATCWHPWPFPPDFSHCPYPHGVGSGHGLYSPGTMGTKPQAPPGSDKILERSNGPAPGSEPIKPMDFQPQLRNRR
jgi:hypothetical protein